MCTVVCWSPFIQCIFEAHSCCCALVWSSVSGGTSHSHCVSVATICWATVSGVSWLWLLCMLLCWSLWEHMSYFSWVNTKEWNLWVLCLIFERESLILIFFFKLTLIYWIKINFLNKIYCNKFKKYLILSFVHIFLKYFYEITYKFYTHTGRIIILSILCTVDIIYNLLFHTVSMLVHNFLPCGHFVVSFHCPSC